MQWMLPNLPINFGRRRPIPRASRTEEPMAIPPLRSLRPVAPRPAASPTSRSPRSAAPRATDSFAEGVTGKAAPQVSVLESRLFPELGVEVQVLAQNLKVPWELHFAPDG